MRLNHRSFLALLVGVTCICAFAETKRPSGAKWVTWAGGEADKGASIWLIQRYLDPTGRIVVVSPETPIIEGIAFDTPEALYRRTHSMTTYESLLDAFPLSDPIVIRLTEILRDVEINAWRPKRFRESAILEQHTQAIADSFPNRHISVACFMQLFDGVYAWLKQAYPQQKSLLTPAICKPSR